MESRLYVSSKCSTEIPSWQCITISSPASKIGKDGYIWHQSRTGSEYDPMCYKQGKQRSEMNCARSETRDLQKGLMLYPIIIFVIHSVLLVSDNTGFSLL